MMLLPPAFSDLESLAQPWVVLETLEERYRARQDMSLEALRALHDRMAPRLPEILAHLDQWPLDSAPEAEVRLYRLCLGLAEAALAIEYFGSARLPGAPYPHHVTVGGAAAESF